MQNINVSYKGYYSIDSLNRNGNIASLPKTNVLRQELEQQDTISINAGKTNKSFIETFTDDLMKNINKF